MIFSILAAGAAQAAEPVIIVTAAREPVAAEDAPASATVYDERALDDLALPALADFLRLTPGVSVSTAGPRGTQTQLRIRGAESNHALVFLDGIRFNDPAAGNEVRLELLTADSLSRLEIVRGPQSALWGSEALGGVVAARTAEPFAARGFEALGEYGSLDTGRFAASVAGRTDTVGIAASAGWQGSDGIDSFGAGGERDGFENLAASLKLEARPSQIVRLGLVGHYIAGSSDYDGTDPVTFRRADTLDRTKNRVGALRGWVAADWGGWSAKADASWLDSANRNFLGRAPLNQTYGSRLSLSGQATKRIGGHQLTGAIEHQAEDFSARDSAFGGATDQDRSRTATAAIAQWRAEWSPIVSTDFALRHDWFSAFADATTLRAALLVRPVERLALHAAYGEGIAQPTLFDLYGFFPGSFIGNPDLKPERSRGWEAGVRWEDRRLALGATWFSARLTDEIVDVFDPATFLSSTENASGRSRREGLELSAMWRHSAALNVTVNYTWLRAEEQRVAGTALLRELRRPRHSANAFAHGAIGKLRWGLGLSYVGARQDMDFDLFPAVTVRLDDYVLASLNLAYRVLPRLELFGRVENGFDADYQDVVGYHTPGRTVHAGLRVALGL